MLPCSSFRSVIVSLRAIVTISFTLAFVYGLATLIYQHGAFSFLHLPGLGNDGALCWISPIMSFSVVCGLALDYDVFLVSAIVPGLSGTGAAYSNSFCGSWVVSRMVCRGGSALLCWAQWLACRVFTSPVCTPFTRVLSRLPCSALQLMRVVEYRMEGYSDRISLARGVYRTGRIITAAGLIMAIAFGALLLSQTPALNQLSFFLSFAVLFDTFVIRSIAVPALMTLLGRWNWWPRKLPVPKYTSILGTPEDRCLPHKF